MEKMTLFPWLLMFGLVTLSLALDNGLVLTPPMGWLTWLKFGCQTDCKNHPKTCIGEELIKRTADKMVSEGYRDAGYEYIIIDDCWLERNRSSDGRLVPGKDQFKSGMKALSDYVHSKNLKFGMYEDIGAETCQGLPGLLGHEKIDAETLAGWGIDYLKVDGCNMDTSKYDIAYPAFGKLLNETGRPIVYSCSWPAYQDKPNYTAIAKHCNLWRNWEDIDMSFESVLSIMDWFGDNQDTLTSIAGPGHWNDPDMLIAGNPQLSVHQARIQIAVWAVLAAPLIMSVDLDEIKPEYKALLLNKDVIDINQDILGIQGRRIFKNDTLEVWKRKVSGGAFAVAFVNRKCGDNTDIMHFTEFTFSKMHLADGKYEVQDLFKEDEPRILESNKKMEVTIHAPGVKFYKFIPMK